MITLKDTIEFSTFVRRQKVDSPYTHFDGKDFQLLFAIQKALSGNGKHWRQGYREGVVLVDVDPEGFYTGLVTLEEGDILVGRYEARREGEAPRKNVRVKRFKRGLCGLYHNGKLPAKRVEIVLYHHDVLMEDNDASSGADWEIISINGYPTYELAPIDPMTLMHNHFGSDGGTNTNMTAEEFESQMRESFEYHKDKALLDITLPDPKQ